MAKIMIAPVCASAAIYPVIPLFPQVRSLPCSWYVSSEGANEPAVGSLRLARRVHRGALGE